MKKIDVFIIYPFDNSENIKEHIDSIQHNFKHFRCITLKEKIPCETEDRWKTEAENEIEISELVIVFRPVGGCTDNMKHEYVTAKNDKKQIIVIRNEEWDECVDKIQNELDNILEKNAAEKMNICAETPEDRSLLMNQYELLITSSENLENRRQVITDRFSTISCAILAIIGTLFILGGLNSQITLLTISLLCVLGIFLSWNWSKHIDSFGKINKSKYRLIHIIEKELSANISDAEWEDLTNPFTGQYVSYTRQERKTPVIIGAMFSVIMVICLIMLLLNVIT